MSAAGRNCSAAVIPPAPVRRWARRSRPAPADRHAPETVALRTPKGIVVEVAPLACHPTEDGAVCVIEKDGGDDADATTGLPVAAEVVLKPERAGCQIRRAGVGLVTKPGP